MFNQLAGNLRGGLGDVLGGSGETFWEVVWNFRGHVLKGKHLLANLYGRREKRCNNNYENLSFGGRVVRFLLCFLESVFPALPDTFSKVCPCLSFVMCTDLSMTSLRLSWDLEHTLPLAFPTNS